MDLSNPFRRHPRTLARLPRIMRVYILNAALGFALAAIFTGLILAFDVAGIRHLVLSVEGGYLAAAVFFVFNGIVFAGVQTGVVLMTLPAEDGPQPPGGAARLDAAVAVRVDA